MTERAGLSGDKDSPVTKPARSIVLLHGGGLSGRMWEPQLAHLPEYHCVVPDLPEQGRSAHIKPFSLDDAAERVADLISERCAGGKAHVVGLSLGGAVALTLMRHKPEVVDRVIVSGTAAGFGRTLGAVSKVSAGMYKWFRPDTLVDMSMRQFRIPSEYREMLREDMVIGMEPTFVRNITDALMTMQLPTASNSPLLAAVGERETRPAKQAARKIAAAVPGAQAVIVPEAGHVWNLERPQLFSDMVRAWCEGNPLPRGLRPSGRGSDGS